MKFLGIDPSVQPAKFAGALLDRKARTVELFRFKDAADLPNLIDNNLPRLRVRMENSYLSDGNVRFKDKKTGKFHKPINFQVNRGFSQGIWLMLSGYFGDEIVSQVSPKEKGKKWNPSEFQWIMKSERLTVKCQGKRKLNDDDFDAVKLALQAYKAYSFEVMTKKKRLNQ